MVVHKRQLVSRQSGLTLLEVMIAISIFALIGLASFSVLSTTVESQRIGDQHSAQLARFQRTLVIVDRDLQQLVDRDIRVGSDQQLGSLLLRSGNYPLEFSRGGWQNPLNLSRSSVQRVAYDIGLHPQAGQEGSSFYGDERLYLRRIYWPVLDREETTTPLIQALLPEVEELQVAVISNKGRHIKWPLPAGNRSGKLPEPKALEFSFTTAALGKITRIYKLESLRQSNNDSP